MELTTTLGAGAGKVWEWLKCVGQVKVSKKKRRTAIFKGGLK